jgi:methylenetetrahydrofolate--tRNA-(uracil-5-)-methyltransferase
MGSLTHYITNADSKHFQPMNIMFGLLPPLEVSDRKRFKNKRDRHHFQVELGLKDFDQWRTNYLSRSLLS